MRAGLFEHWQAEYAERRVSTFPVRPDKTPAVRGYLGIGRKASEQMAMSFPDATGIGLACRRNRITVLDVDTTDERILADGLAQYGDTPFIVRSGSGHYQAWYRHNGEGRRIRPDTRVPIDILGDGFVVAPPSQAIAGVYQIIRGSLDDLQCLPKMSDASDKSSPSLSAGDSEPHPVTANIRSEPGRTILLGQGRNDDLFRQCLKLARTCKRLEELMDKAMEYNRGYPEPLPADEVLKVIASAWGYEVEGKNWVGYGPRLVMEATLVGSLAAADPRAFALLSILRLQHKADGTFILAKSMTETLKWSINTFRGARDALIERGLIECIHAGGGRPNDPPIYRFKGVNL
ncbi:bifunctional DNA primase/polymerase [Devosia alba]|uniref:bifunctional DNA primase/polymerase n=1 Tax=Devosia alba TaxID=3152360 RepID=UPI003266203D